jgi:hypothetical protein
MYTKNGVPKGIKATLLIFCLISLLGVQAYGVPPTLDDFWASNASWSLDATQIGANFGFHFPSMFLGRR